MPDGVGYAPVENEDTATALIRFKNGAHGSLSTSRSAWGRKNILAWGHGSHGMIMFDQERMNELQLYQRNKEAYIDRFQSILTGPEHEPYAVFCPAAGHQLGFND